jgi:hypothetical protein
MHRLRLRCAALAVAIVASTPLACGEDGTGVKPGGPERTFRMGFSAIPPTNDTRLLQQSLDMWARRADAAIMHGDVPWGALIDGTSATTAARAIMLDLANYYRAHNLSIVVMLDVTNGLARDREAAELVARGRSITEPAIQRLYRNYALAVADVIRPAYLGLAPETNLIRATAPKPVYDAVVQMTNAAAADLRASGVTPLPQLYVSVQVEVAWGQLAGGAFVGAEQDFRDFPFVQALGLSSYPFFVRPDPDDLPNEYYSRIVGDRSTPVLVVEGGWTSASIGSISSSPAKQSRFLVKQAQLLDRAKAVALFQLTFTDLDLTTFPADVRVGLAPFASLGMVGPKLESKPALATWDTVFARPLRR